MEKPRPYSTHDLDKAISSIDGGPMSGREALDYGAELDVILDDFRYKKVLDLGAGSGLGLARGLQKLAITSEVHSFSPAFSEPGPAQEATGFIQDAPSKLVVAGMGEELPYKDDSFDMVVSLHCFEHLSSRTQVMRILEEITRVLKPLGVCYIGPLPDARPFGFDEERFITTKALIENSFAERPGVELHWKRRKAPFDLIRVSDGKRKYPAICYVLKMIKSE